MNWIPIALISPIALALVNLIDKTLIEKYFKGGEVGALLIFSGIVGLPVTVLIWILNPTAISIPILAAVTLTVNGILYLFSLFPYFKALELEDASTVSPLFLTTPVIGLLLGFLFLNEVPQTISLIASAIIAIGAFLLSADLTDHRHPILKRQMFFLMLAASFLTAVNALIFKFISIEVGFWTTAFWEYIGFIVFAAVILAFKPTFRLQFIQVFKSNSAQLIGVNAFNETLAVAAKLSLHFATLLAPLGLVFFVAEGTQPLFVLLFALIATKLWPQYIQESISKKALSQKIIAIALMSSGLYLLSLA